jgi:hypothetical protein
MGQRFAAAIAGATGMPCLGFVFDDEAAGLPDLGGIERSLAKRSRHRRVLVRLLLSALGTRRILICIDPSRLDVVRDLAGDRGQTRILQVCSAFSDEELEGHARRIGLAGEATPPASLARLLPTLRQDIMQETARVRDGRLAPYHELVPGAGAERAAAELGAFLGLGPAEAERLAATPGLLSD